MIPRSNNEKVYSVNFEAENGREIYKTVCEIIGIAVLSLDEKAEISAQENIAAVLQNMLDANIGDPFRQQCTRVAIRLMTD
ncbi:hypothetical protein CLM68_16885 [Serratia marcescens]|nr:hypothetical protein AM470_19635 [Serratia marcescens]AVN48774.1 hypothetical protein AM478_02970 [Serratia marcescens]RLO42268.1 hypothetical protein CLM68_16885 [Serratia marcescens]